MVSDLFLLFRGALLRGFVVVIQTLRVLLEGCVMQSWPR